MNVIFAPLRELKPPTTIISIENIELKSNNRNNGHIFLIRKKHTICNRCLEKDNVNLWRIFSLKELLTPFVFGLRLLHPSLLIVTQGVSSIVQIPWFIHTTCSQLTHCLSFYFAVSIVSIFRGAVERWEGEEGEEGGSQADPQQRQTADPQIWWI